MRTLPVLACVAVLACPAAAAPPPAPGLNVVLISLNALRADRLEVYGYARDTAPNISRLAREAVVFDRAVSQSHWTLSSLASLFTSKYVHSHGLYERGGRLSETEVTLAETLKAAGYKTAAFTGGLDTSGIYGLRQGFDVYSDGTGSEPMGSFREIMPGALKWLAAHRGDRFFIFLDSYDIHPPFDKPGPAGSASGYSGFLKGKELNYGLFRDFRDGALIVNGKRVELAKADLDYINSRYDNGIAYSDRFVGEFLARLGELGLSGSTLVILTAEHGEELGDHGSFDRFGSGNLYDEAIRVPLLIRIPGKDLKGMRVTAQVQLIDVMPTILELTGLKAAAGAQGSSLLPFIEGGRAPEGLNLYVYSEAGPNKWAVSTGEWKLIYENGEYSLFNLAVDRAESENAAVKNPAVVYGLAQKLMEWRRRTRTAKSPDDTKVTLTEDMKRKLREAGYWR